DDGLLDFRTEAFPVMRELGIPATVFVSTAFIGGTFIDGRRCLAAGDIAELAAAGVEFGSHTMTHPQLHDTPAVDGFEELAGSATRLSQILGGGVESFSYPFRFPSEDAAFVAGLAESLERCGYRQGVTTAIGVARPSDP